MNYSPDGYEWIDYSDNENTVLSLIRKSENDYMVVVLNFAPVVRKNYRIGIPENKVYKEILNSDHFDFGGSNVLNDQDIKAEEISAHGRPNSIALTLPPLGGILLKPIK